MPSIKGIRLREEMKRQLLEDLKYYLPSIEDLSIDLSQAVPEGPRHDKCLDGFLQTYSNIYILSNVQQRHIGGGWIDFLYYKKEKLFIIYWDVLYINNKKINNFGLPKHIIDKIPEKLKKNDKLWRRVKKGTEIDIYEIN